MYQVNIPGLGDMVFCHLILDINGTLTTDGKLIPGVKQKIIRLSEWLDITLLTADTFGTADAIAHELGQPLQIVGPNEVGINKLKFVNTLDPQHSIAIGNGSNDRQMLAEVALSIAVIGQEGCSAQAIQASMIVVRDINDGLDLLLNKQRLMATLRT
ncbi:MAG: HAD family hydrolase [Chitinophagales bacterium]